MALQRKKNSLSEQDIDMSQSQKSYPHTIKQIFDKYEFVYCWVEGESIKKPAHIFEFNFKLWCRSHNDFIPFHVNFKTLQRLLSYVCEEKIYFATQKFPQTSINRCKSLQDTMTFMENLMHITNRIECPKNNTIYVCSGPGKLHWYSKKFAPATNDDLEAMVHTLNKLLNSPQLTRVEDLHDVFSITNDNLINTNIFTTLNIPETTTQWNVKEHIQSEAAKLLKKLKAKDVQVPFGLTWTKHDIIPDIQFEETKDSIQEGFTADQCRLNNPNGCWKPNTPNVSDDNKYPENPELIIKLGERRRKVTKLRIQGYRLNGKLLYIKKFQLYYKYWNKEQKEWKWRYNKDYKIDGLCLDVHGYVDIELVPMFYTREIKIIPTEFENEIALRLEIFGHILFNHQQLFALPHIMFQQFYVAIQPGNVNELNLINHWAMKFEGAEYLLTVEWFNNNRILSTLEYNTCIGQRKCWFSSKNDKTEWFTQRWGTNFKLPIIRSECEINQKEISAECIGKLVDCWLKEFGKYDVVENNCQHMVRDIVSLFSKHAAKYLVRKMEHVQWNTAIHPVLEACDERSGHKRLHRIREKLLCTFEQYQKEKQHVQREERKQMQQDVYNVSFMEINKLSWSARQCSEWIGALGAKYKQYMQEFIDSGIDGDFFNNSLDDETLKEIVQSALHRKKILSAWNKLQ